MKKDLLLLPVLFAYFVFAYAVCRWVFIRTRLYGSAWRITLRSFACAMFFGFGTISDGGGFPVPAPVIFAAIYSDPMFIIIGSVIPCVFCWVLIWIALWIDAYFKKREQAKRTSMPDE